MILTHKHDDLCTCGNHNQLITYRKMKQYDPTRTVSIRNAFAGQMSKRFNNIAYLVKQAVDDQDCFGLKNTPTTFVTGDLPAKRAFAFATSQEKIQSFMQWLQEQVDKGILTLSERDQLGAAIQQEWTNLYIEDSYKRGVIRARYEMIKAGWDIPSIEASGGILSVMALPMHVDRLGLLYTRTYEELKGVTNSMSQMMSRILAQGMMDGDHPRLMAKKLVQAITGKGEVLGITDTLGRWIPAKRRAEMIARTETIRAHHLATIQEYRNWGLVGVKVMAEWSTAGDDRVCPKCDALQGKVFTLDEIEPVIPLHPNCFPKPKTAILTSTGWKPIYRIKVNNLVLTHKLRWRKVTALHFRQIEQECPILVLGFDYDKKIDITENHPILVKKGNDSATWKKAIDCVIGEEVVFYAKTELGVHTQEFRKIVSIKSYVLRKGKYLNNFSVDEDESYIADGMIVHNCRCIALPTAPDIPKTSKNK